MFEHTLFRRGLQAALSWVLLAFLTAGAALAGTVYHYPPGATASTIPWPSDSHWTLILALNDPNDGLSNAHIDFVGDATDPGFYICGANGFLFYRIRIKDPSIASYNEINGSIFVLIESDGVLSTVDYAFTWDAKSSDQSKHGLEMQVKDLVGPSWSSSR